MREDAETRRHSDDMLLYINTKIIRKIVYREKLYKIIERVRDRFVFPFPFFKEGEMSSDNQF